uniref:Uncharacterized protein n=1 Tax=viral metagenome TaxID=1070528 RepID=A0A6C0B9Y9_9ZZZZ
MKQNNNLILEDEYENFDWNYYINYYNDLSKKDICDKYTAWQHWNKIGKKEGRYLFKLPTREKYTFEKFDWISYITINDDLINMTRNEAWDHWRKHGISENRPLSRINNTCIHRARFGNLFFINMAYHFIALKNNAKISYKYYKKFKELGICFFIGEKTYDKEIYLSDNAFYPLIQSGEILEKNIVIDINNFFCQTKEFCFFIREQFNKVFKESIIKKNIFKDRYNNNRDIFLHIRLGDVKNENDKQNTFLYYDKILSSTDFEIGYISSDSIYDDICKSLIDKYNLQIIDFCEVSTIMFASTCRNIILSGGTFSWLIGFLAFYSDKIYYPQKKSRWYDDIFVFNEWVGVKV